VKPGEVLPGLGSIALHAGRPTVEVLVENRSTHVIFVSSHYPFFEVNRRLAFDRSRAWGMHLDIPAGDAERWGPGETRRVRLVAFGGRRTVRGFNHLTDGPATPARLGEALARARARGYAHRPPDGGEAEHGQ